MQENSWAKLLPRLGRSVDRDYDFESKILRIVERILKLGKSIK
jgi:hypothetical protein